jgi:hypothetical protein
MKGNYSITPEQFVRAWQESCTLAEVSQKTGLPKSTCYNRARYYRRKGVGLKAIQKQRNLISWAALNVLATGLQE